MTTREVQYRDEEYNVIIHLRQARVVEGMKRTQIIQNTLERSTLEDKDALKPTIENLAHRVVTFYTYPACIAATTSVENPKSYTGEDDKSHPFTDGKELASDVPLEEFLELPEALVLMWEEAAYELNPHWVPQLIPREVDEPAEDDALPDGEEQEGVS